MKAIAIEYIRHINSKQERNVLNEKCFNNQWQYEKKINIFIVEKY